MFTPARTHKPLFLLYLLWDCIPDHLNLQLFWGFAASLESQSMPTWCLDSQKLAGIRTPVLSFLLYSDFIGEIHKLHMMNLTQPTTCMKLKHTMCFSFAGHFVLSIFYLLMIFTWTYWLAGSLGCFEIHGLIAWIFTCSPTSGQVVEVGRCASSYGTMTLPGSTTQDLEGVETTIEMDEDRWILHPQNLT